MRDYTHLTKNDRQRLYTYLDMGLSIRAISKKLLRHPSTLRPYRVRSCPLSLSINDSTFGINS
ncbi:TPA: helix-turn-helix domain-containing protein [Legionella pneumophila]|uniref:Helix-turn-helix domain-containing protein n=1 Tax=Legionella pneumophila TaxID=446 RepID=A0A2S6EXA5_LEGPN|nr:helix-turn-helix domain-containing protein [Legionella pneumophila]MBG1729229.1 helix-turn-helix domain-containing protein [Legionella pneumophila]MCW8429231.1 helix-turn-helix domain-containing protein [Legionella pneumophila]PPK29808.1 helix-turn-helix domain-containing protein [Legionella pneumophila]RYB33510.1 helix-turn-helix domain-containing protein [Legionella pneumophila]RYW22685.1 helix-turn-helix domain-containing protein [Legionella pneumophila]